MPGVRTAFAHAVLVWDQSRRAVLAQPPVQIRLWFIKRDYSWMSAVDAAGRTVSTEQAQHPPTRSSLCSRCR